MPTGDFHPRQALRADHVACFIDNDVTAGFKDPGGGLRNVGRSESIPLLGDDSRFVLLENFHPVSGILFPVEV